MSAFLLNSNSVLICPHGGMISHVPVTFTTYRVDGRFPMLFTDNYFVTGCPNFIGWPSPCTRIQWLVPSAFLFIKGIPVLTSASVGLCMSASGVPQGPVTIAAIRSFEKEPATPTFIQN